MFISFCVNGTRSVSNDKHFVLCYDRWHIYSIVLIFDELLYEIFFFFFLINIAAGFRLYIIHRLSLRDIFLSLSLHPSAHSVRPQFLPVQNHISVPIIQIEIFLCTTDKYHVLSISYKFRQMRPCSTGNVALVLVKAIIMQNLYQLFCVMIFIFHQSYYI